MSGANDMKVVIGKTLRSIAVELADEFDKNFTREAFFSSAWPRRVSPINSRYKSLAGPQQALRKSIGSRVSADSVEFNSDSDHAAIHNEGGEIKVTAKMKRFFRAKFWEAMKKGGWHRGGSLVAHDGNRRLLPDGAIYAMLQKSGVSEEARFWGIMSMMKEGRTIKIPKRQFLGISPEVETIIRRVIEDDLTEFFNNYELIIKK